MDMNSLIRLRPTLGMIAEELALLGWACRPYCPDKGRQLRGVRLYSPGQQLQEDMLYLLRGREPDFPVDSHCYLSAAPRAGKGEHLICPGRSEEEILDCVMEIFYRFQQWEDAINQLMYRDAGLQELCDLAGRLLENPVCIHDDWFVMMAATRDFFEIMEPEYLMSSAKGFVPSAVVKDFRDDSDYLETYTHHDAQLWEQPEQVSMYVNLWDGPIYKGRLLVSRKNRDFRACDFLLAEALTQRVLMVLRRGRIGDQMVYQNMDDIVYALLQGTQSNPTELGHLLKVLGWSKTDTYLCVRIMSQQTGSAAMMEQLLHNELFQIFPGAYVMLSQQEQCVVLNLTQSRRNVSYIRHLLAPLCRDYYRYAGISSPVQGITELQGAYYQAGAALHETFLLRGDKWLMHFSECAMDHLLRNLPNPLTAAHLIAPELLELIAYDREKDTQYFETLREYLLQERDIPRTSQKLIIHRTTLIYRLKKIQSLLRCNLDDPWQRLYLTFSLWLMEKESRV